MEGKKPSILLFTLGFPSPSDPRLGIFVYRAALALEDRYEVTVMQLQSFNFRRKFIKRDKYKNVRVLRMAFFQLPHLNRDWIIRLNSWLYRVQGRFFFSSLLNQYDYFHSSAIYPTGVIVGYWAKLLNKKHISWATGDDVNRFLPFFKRSWINRKLLKRVNSIQFCSRVLQQSFGDLMKTDDAIGFVGYNGVELSQFPIKDRFNNTPNLRFLFLGGFQTYDSEREEQLNVKGGHILLKAWSEIDNKYPKVKLTIGGPGTVSNRLEEWINGLNNPEQVTVMDRQIDPGEISKLLWDHDVVIMPSLNEGLPNLANEAQASGTPVLASNTGGVPETVEHLSTGFLIERASVEALKDGIEWFIANCGSIERMGLQGRERMTRLFSWEAFATGVESNFQKMVAIDIS